MLRQLTKEVILELKNVSVMNKDHGRGTIKI